MMNDYKNDSRAPDRTEADDDALLSLLRGAYPSPPPGMADRVMARIREEEQAGDEKLLPAADSRKKGLRRALIRWGALAACVVLVGSVGLKVLPVFTKNMTQKSADSALPEEARADTAAEMAEDAVEEALEDAAYVTAEIPAAMEAAEDGSAPDSLYDSSLMAKSASDIAGAASEMAEPEEAFDEAAPMAPAAMEEPAEARSGVTSVYAGEASGEWDYYADEEEAAEEAVEDGLFSVKLFTLNGMTGLHAVSAEEGEIPMMAGAPTNEAQDSREVNGLDYYYVRTACAHADTFRNSYHDIPDVLIARVGPMLYGSWATKVQNEDLCGVNILSFALRFNLTAEDIYSTGDTWYFLDLPEDIPLTEENAGAVEQYYLNGGDPGKMVPRVTVYELKTAMIREAGLSAYAAWRGENSRTLISWSVREGAAALGLDDETMNRLYEEAAEKVAAEYGDEYMPSREEVFAG